MSSGEIDQSQPLTGQQLAQILQVRPQTVAMWARQGRIPCLQLGRKIRRFRLAEVLHALSHADSRVTAEATR